jgi:hypothetical protein
VTVHVWRPEVSGITPNPRLQFPLQYIEKTSRGGAESAEEEEKRHIR